jgi:hypothetical protein
VRHPTRLLVFVLAGASGAIVARAQSQAALPKPGPEVKRLAVMVGRFRNEGEVKAGAMGPNSPAMKVRGTDECRWTAGGFGLVCTYTYDIGGTKWGGTSLLYYDSSSKIYRYHALYNTGEFHDQTGRVSGDTWTWTGESALGGKVAHTRYVMKFVSEDSWEYTDSWSESKNPVEPSSTGKDTRVAATKTVSKPEQ